MAVKKTRKLLDVITGPIVRPLELNQNQGTVTIDYQAYYHMHHDSVILHLLLTCEDEDVRHRILDDLLKERNWLGHGFRGAQCPVCDIDAICCVYGLSRETVERMIYFPDAYMEDDDA